MHRDQRLSFPVELSGISFALVWAVPVAAESMSCVVPGSGHCMFFARIALCDALGSAAGGEIAPTL